MLGAFIMHPKQPYDPPVDRDFVILLQEYAILPSNATPNSMNMEFNWLTFNGKAGPATTPLLVRLGDRVRIRMVNLGMDHHPIHLHGHTFVVTGSEGGRQPKTTWAPGNTVLVGVAQARDIEFVANNPGDWMLHCHLPHHMMNQMSSTVGPLTRRPGMPMGVSMENGMGMLDGTPGVPVGDDYGPSLGRGLGIGSTNDQPTPNGPLSQERAKQAMATMLEPGNARYARWRNARHAARRGGASRKCQSSSRLPAGRFHGGADDGHGQNGRQAGELWPAAGLERLHAGHDDLRSRTSS